MVRILNADGLKLIYGGNELYVFLILITKIFLLLEQPYKKDLVIKNFFGLLQIHF